MPIVSRRTYSSAFFWIMLLGFFGLLSCQTEDCTSIYNNYMLVGFFKTDTLENGQVVTTPQDTVFYSITAEDNDSVFYDMEDIKSTFRLPVNPAADFTSFRLEMLDSIRYDSLTKEYSYYKNPNPLTLSVKYHRNERIIVEDCGTEISYTKLSLQDSAFQNTAVVSKQLSRLNEITQNKILNIEVYF